MTSTSTSLESTPTHLIRISPSKSLTSSSQDSRPRILFVLEAVTLAHIARGNVLAFGLDPTRYQVAIACDPRYNRLFDETRPSHIQQFSLKSITSAAFIESLRQGKPAYSTRQLSEYVEEERQLFASYRPDVIIGDFRLSLGITTELYGIPYINISNAGWSPYANYLDRPIVPYHPITHRIGPWLAQKIFNVIREPVFRLFLRPINACRAKYGLEPLVGSIQTAYGQGDVVLYADLPQVVPLSKPAPLTHVYTGPINWSPKISQQPSWIDRLNARGTSVPIIYVTLGSSGVAATLPIVLEALADLPCSVVASTAGASLPPSFTPPDNAFIESFLDGDHWSREATIVICNGGSPSCYQAFYYGHPVIGMADNLDQFMNMTAVEASGAGVNLRAATLKAADVKAQVKRLFEDQSFTQAAVKLQTAMQLHPKPNEVLEKMIDFVKAAPKKPTLMTYDGPGANVTVLAPEKKSWSIGALATLATISACAGAFVWSQYHATFN